MTNKCRRCGANRNPAGEEPRVVRYEFPGSKRRPKKKKNVRGKSRPLTDTIVGLQEQFRKNLRVWSWVADNRRLNRNRTHGQARSGKTPGAQRIIAKRAFYVENGVTNYSSVRT